MAVTESRVRELELKCAKYEASMSEMRTQVAQVQPLSLTISELKGKFDSVGQEMHGMRTLMSQIAADGERREKDVIQRLKESQETRAKEREAEQKEHEDELLETRRERKQIRVALIGAGAIVLASLIGFAAVLISAGPPHIG